MRKCLSARNCYVVSMSRLCRTHVARTVHHSLSDMSNTEFRNAVPAMAMGADSLECMLQHGSLSTVLAMAAARTVVAQDEAFEPAPTSTSAPTVRPTRKD